MCELYLETVTPTLYRILQILMKDEMFTPFCLVGGTSLSLRMGHRKSVDIDLFTSAEYKTIDFQLLQQRLRKVFPICQGECGDIVGMGTSYMIGFEEGNLIKLDLYYTKPFISPMEIVDGIRLAGIEDIVAMKLEAIGNGGRKKDFWDIHELRKQYPLAQMLELYRERYPYSYSKHEILYALENFNQADSMPDPKCLLKKSWPFIKMDLYNWVEQYKQNNK